MWVGLWRKLRAEELMLLNCGVGEDSWESLGSNQSILKDISSGWPMEGIMLKLKCQYLATWCEHLTHWKRPWCWGRLRAGGEVDNRGWDDWMASLTQWIWWRTGKLDVLQSMGSQRVGHNLATEQQWPQQSTLLHFMLNHIQWNFFMAIFHILSPSSYTVRWISRAFCLLRIYKCVKIQNDK